MQDIDTIISESNNQINDKILGIAYLEKLKYLLIDGLKNINIPSFNEIKNNEILKIHGENNLKVNIKNHSSALSTIKNMISSDYLCIVLQGTKSIEFHDILNSKISNKLDIFPFMGIAISNNTIISESIAKETILLDIFQSTKKNEI